MILGRLSFIAVFSLFFYTVPATADVIYFVTVDTTAIGGTAGNIDFQFNPGGPSTQAAFASISLFSSSGGTLTGAPSTIGDVTGTLPANVTIANTSTLNDYFQPFTFGTSFQFQLLLGGPAINSPNGTSTSGSSFALSLLNSLGDAAFLTTDPNGFAGIANVALNGHVSTTVFPSNANGGPPVVTFTTTSVVPEPSTFSFICCFFLAIAGAAALHRKSNT
jgi:hypothetical protein